MRDVLKALMCWKPSGAGALHTGQAGRDSGVFLPPKPAAGTGKLLLHPLTDTQSPSLGRGGHTLQSPHRCCHRVPGTPAQGGPVWMAFLGEKQSFSGLESTSVFDLALFCFSLQLSAVFGHSPASPAIFHVSVQQQAGPAQQLHSHKPLG